MTGLKFLKFKWKLEKPWSVWYKRFNVSRPLIDGGVKGQLVLVTAIQGFLAFDGFVFFHISDAFDQKNNRVVIERQQGGGVAGTDAGGLATGISLALVNTLLGLGLAIVGLGFFGLCRNRVDSLTVQATVQVLDLLEYFRPTPAGIQGIDAQRPYRSSAVAGRLPKTSPGTPKAK